jgi:hypothetical protein
MRECSELSSGIYCRVQWLSTGVWEVRTASIIGDEYIPEDNSEHHTSRRENLKSHKMRELYVLAVSVWFGVKVNYNDRKYKAWTAAGQDFIRKTSIPQLSLKFVARLIVQELKHAEVVHYFVLNGVHSA